jgi:hypothetical protein
MLLAETALLLLRERLVEGLQASPAGIEAQLGVAVAALPAGTIATESHLCRREVTRCHCGDANEITLADRVRVRLFGVGSCG